MSFKDDLEGHLAKLVDRDFNHRWGRIVPSSDGFGPFDAVTLSDAAYLYTDMADSSSLSTRFSKEDGARVLRVFLYAVSQVIKNRKGEIRSFDGDRVMGIFVGEDAANQAVDAALRISWAVTNSAHDTLLDLASYRKAWVDDDWKVRHRTGIDLGYAYVVRAGIRDHNDLVSIGYPPNIAAKLSDYKAGGTSNITSAVYEKLSDKNKHSVDSSRNDGVVRNMWTDKGWKTIGDSYEHLYSTTWRRGI